MTRFTGNEVKLLRKFFGMSQAQLAHMIGSYQNTICDAERLNENEYISHVLNLKLIKGLTEHGFDPDALLSLIDQYRTYIHNKLEKGSKQNEQTN